MSGSRMSKFAVLAVIVIVAAAAFPLSASASPSLTEKEASIRGALGEAGGAAVREAADRSSSRSEASVAKKKKKKKRKKKKFTRLKMTIPLADYVTYQTAYEIYLSPEFYDATEYGTNGCTLNTAYAATCVGYVAGYLDFDPSFPYLCDWYQDVWYTNRNVLMTYAYQPECYAL